MLKLKKYFGPALIIIGLAGIALSIALYATEARPPKLSSIKSVGIDPAPSSKKITVQQVSSYQVPADNPKYIAIPAIGLRNNPVVL